MIPGPQIALLDDDPEHLNRLCQSLNEMGTAALPILFENGAPSIPKPLSSLQLLFVDIHLVPAVPLGPQAYDIVATALEKIVAPDCGPYVFVSWSTYPNHHQTLMAHLAENLAAYVPPPAATVCLDKNKYMNGPDDIAQCIRDAVSTAPQADGILHWCEAARVASGEVANSLLNLVERAERFDGTSGQKLEKLLTAIAREGAGGNAARDLPAAMTEGLGPILTDRLLHSTAANHQVMSGAWTRAIRNVGADPKLEDEEKAALNTMTAVSTHDIDNVPAGSRGAVCSLPADLADPQGFERSFGCDPTTAFFHFIRMKEREDREDQELNSGEKKALRKAVQNECEFRLVGLSAACDHAWGKVPVKKLLLAVEFPATHFGNFAADAHAALYSTPPFVFPSTDQNGVLVFNWRYFLAVPGDFAGVDVLYRLREPLMSHLATSYHVHGFRPGIPDF